MVLVQNSPATIIEDMTMDAAIATSKALDAAAIQSASFIKTPPHADRNTVLNAVWPEFGRLPGWLGHLVETAPRRKCSTQFRQ